MNLGHCGTCGCEFCGMALKQCRNYSVTWRNYYCQCQ